MQLISTGIEVIHAVLVPVFLADVLDLPDSIEIIARLEGCSICRAHADHLTGIIIRTGSAASASSAANRCKGGNDQ